MRVVFTPSFLREMKKAQSTLQEEAIEKIEMLKDAKNRRVLKVHKLKGPFRGCYGFSVNFKTRIIFEYIGKDEVVLHTIGNHSIYD